MAFELPPLPNFQPNIPQMPSALDQYGKMLQLKSLLGEQQLQPYQVQEAQQKVQAETMANQKAQMEMESRQAMIKALADPDFQKEFTGTDQANANGLGIDPAAMFKGLVSRGVKDPDVANGFINQMIERSKNIAEITKTNSQAGEAQAAIRTKGLEQLHSRVAGIVEDPSLAPSLLNDLLRNPDLFKGVPQDDLAHVFMAAQSGDIASLKAAAGALDIDKILADFHKSKSEAASAAQKVIPPNGGLSPDNQNVLKKDILLETNPQVVGAKATVAGAEANARQQAAQGDPNTAGKLLADGSLTLNDLKTRGNTAKFIEQATLAAQKISPTYNPADENIAEQVAKSPSANQFFGSANSLIGKGGTLDQLEKLGKDIPQHDWPVLNTVDDWQKLARGKGPLAGYAATALGAADDYGKVMGGGNASDHARDAALALFAKAASPEQRAQAIAATRNAVLSQRDARIGTNQFLKRQYGSGELGGVATRTYQGHTYTQQSDGSWKLSQ